MTDIVRKNILIIHKNPSRKDIVDLLNLDVDIIILGCDITTYTTYNHVMCVNVDPFDHNALIAAVDSLKQSVTIDAVVPIWEATVVETSIVANHLGLNGNSIDAVINARNKSLMASCLASNNIATAKSYLVRCIDEAIQLLKGDLSYPCILKLPFSANSQSVILVHNQVELVEAFHRITEMYGSDDNPYLLSFQSDKIYSNTVLVQEYLEGTELNIDLAYCRDTFSVLGVFEKAPMRGPYFAEYRSTFPTSLSDSQLDECYLLAQEAVKALGASVGCAHVEVKYGEHGPAIIELSLRPGGAYTMYAIELVSGIKEIQLLVQLLLYNRMAVHVMSSRKACLYGGIVLEKSGVISEIVNLDILKSIPQIVDYNVLFKSGDLVKALPEGSKIHLVHYIMTGDSLDDLMMQDSKIRSTINYTIR